MKRLLTDKYRFKPKEAETLADFLLPMLRWYPHKRATAQQMLSHPWLSMPADYNYRMSDLEFKKMSLKQTIEGVSEGEQFAGGCSSYVYNEGDHISDLADSEWEDCAADEEDNYSTDSDESLSCKKGERHKVEEEEFNLNISFNGGYVPNTDLSRVDKGEGNAQFKNIEINK